MSETYIGGFHAVEAALDDADKKPREVLILGGRKDARMASLLTLAERRKVTVRTVSNAPSLVAKPAGLVTTTS